jgi:hypothetical protein
VRSLFQQNKVSRQRKNYQRSRRKERGSTSNNMNSLARTVIIVLLILFLIGSLPAWPYSSGWGYYPSTGLGTILVIVVILLLLGKL